MTLLNGLKTIIYLSLFLCIAPFLITNIKRQYIHITETQTPIGVLHIPHNFDNSLSFIRQLHLFFKDTTIQALLINIDCEHVAPGTSQTIFHDIRQLKKAYPKPIIALVENKCTSGAYLIASACDYIIAPESSIIGDIGPSFNSINQEIEEESYQQLIKHIALSRKLSLTTIHNWADGKLFTANQAITLGLINEIGSLCTVIKVIKEKALLEGDIEWIEEQQKHTLLNITLSNECAIT
jgi:ClpP class serine protease